MGRWGLYAGCGVAILFACAAYGQSGATTMSVKDWNWCKGKLSPRCVTADSLHAVPTFNSANGSSLGPADLSAAHPSGKLPYNAEYELVSVRKPDGTSVWIEPKLLDAIFCAPDKNEMASGRRPTTSAQGMGSGAPCS